MVPHLNKNDRKEVINFYLRLFGENKIVSNAIIERDRERLRKLLSGKKRK